MLKLSQCLALLMIIALSGCSLLPARQPAVDIANPAIGLTHTQSASPGAAARDLNVFAAASLNGAFQEIGHDFEAAHPGVKVNFNYAGSQILRLQIEQGARADVFASADRKNMDSLVAEKLVSQGTVEDFASNQMIVILPAGNPANIQGLADLARPGVKLVLADASVPAGSYARQVLVKMDADPAYGAGYSAMVMANVVSNETDVKQVVAKVELGEADGGIVYASDAVAAPDLHTITIPEPYNVTASYPIAVLTGSPNFELAQAFVDFVLSPAGQSILGRWGFSEAVH